MSIKHSKVSGVSDTANPANVRPSDWNAAHEGTNIHDHSSSGSGGNVNHTNLTSIGTHTHAQIDTFMANPIAGSAIMSTTTGSVVKHNTSGITAGSYNKVTITSFGHVTEGSAVAYLTAVSGVAPITVTSSSAITHDNIGTVGAYNRVITDAKGHITTGSDLGYQTVSAITGSSVMSDTTGSIVKHNASGVVNSGSYNQIMVDTFGHVTSASFIDIFNQFLLMGA